MNKSEPVALSESINLIGDDAQARQEYLTHKDQALNVAWQRLLSYHKQGNWLYQVNRRMRFAIIGLTFLASFVAVLITQIQPQDLTLGEANPAIANIPFVAEWGVRNIFRFLLVVLPITLAAMATYAIEFSPSVTWIIFTALRNHIISEIYQYRARAHLEDNDADVDSGEIFNYQHEKISQRQRALIKQTSRKEIAKYIPIQETKVPHWLNDSFVFHGDPNRITFYAGKPNKPLHEAVDAYLKKWTDYEKDKPSDDGYSSLTAEEYVRYRALPRRNYYVETSKSQYRLNRWFLFLILAISGLGAIIAGVSPDWAWLVVVTTSGVTALSALNDLSRTQDDPTSLFEAVYKVDEALAMWRILPDNKRGEDPLSRVETVRLVRTCEQVFRDENLGWHQSALRLQSAADEFMVQNIRDLKVDERELTKEEKQQVKEEGEKALQGKVTDNYMEILDNPDLQDALVEGVDGDDIRTTQEYVAFAKELAEKETLKVQQLQALAEADAETPVAEQITVTPTAQATDSRHVEVSTITDEDGIPEDVLAMEANGSSEKLTVDPRI